MDNNCDDVVDDCEEDNWPPEITIGAAPSQCSMTWFLTASEALECVQSQTKVQDDCDEDLTEATFTLFGTCFDSEYEIDASDRCGNPADTVTVPVLIDDNLPPEVDCYFEDSSGGTTQTLVLYDRTGNNQLENVGLKYNATDGCQGDVQVRVEVYSNEIEDFHSQEMALLFQDANPNDAVGLYVAKGICSTDSNGQCIKDPNSESIRLYTVVVTGTDLADLSASAECQILIIPKNLILNIHQDELDASTQRFFLTSYESTFAGASQP